mgnify:CR=1 FL=1
MQSNLNLFGAIPHQILELLDVQRVCQLYSVNSACTQKPLQYVGSMDLDLDLDLHLHLHLDLDLSLETNIIE